MATQQSNIGSSPIYGSARTYAWMYRPFQDELVVTTPDQVFKLAIYRRIGRPESIDALRRFAEKRIIEDAARLEVIERQYTGLAYVEQTRRRSELEVESRPHFRRPERIFHMEDGWYASTRESHLGPFDDRAAAERALRVHVGQLSTLESA